MSGDRSAVLTYCLLRDVWWPHPAHGLITIEQMPHLLAFHCVCGEHLGIPLFVARDIGLIA